jgi:hypothetical protein
MPRTRTATVTDAPADEAVATTSNPPQKQNTHVAVLFTHKTAGPVVHRVHRALANAYGESLNAESFVKTGSVKIVEIIMADRERLASLA